MPNLYEELVSHPGQAADLIARLGPSSPSDRKDALAAVKWLVNAFLVPAKSLLATSDEEPDYRYFNLQEIAGSDFPDLLLGLLADDFPSLHEPLPDRELAPLLDQYGFGITDPDKRKAFFIAWTAQRAIFIIRRLLKVLEDANASDPAAESMELDELRQLMAAPLPELDRDLIGLIIKKRTSNAPSG